MSISNKGFKDLRGSIASQEVGRNYNNYLSSQNSLQSFASSQPPQGNVVKSSFQNDSHQNKPKSPKNSSQFQKQMTGQSSVQNLHSLKTQQTKKNRKKIQAQDLIKVENMDQKNADLQNLQNMRNNEQGRIQELHRETYQSKVKTNAEQFQSTMISAIEHFTANYGETLNMKTTVEYAPRYDYNLLEKENKELKKQHDPLKKEMKKEVKNQKNVQLKYEKLMANVNYTRSMKKRYESKLDELKDQLKDFQFYCNDLDEAVQRERISRENHLLIFKRIINRINTEKHKCSETEAMQLEQQMREFIEVADGKLQPRLMTEQKYKPAHIVHPKIKSHSISTIDARDNPPTTTTRGIRTDRTIDMAHDYIKRLETEVKKMENEHKFLRQRLDVALKVKENKSVGSWQYSEADKYLEDFSGNTNGPNTADRNTHYPNAAGGAQSSQKNIPLIDPNILALKLPKFQTQASEKKLLLAKLSGPDGNQNRDLINLKGSLNRPKTAMKKTMASQATTNVGSHFMSKNALSPNATSGNMNKLFSSTAKSGSLFRSQNQPFGMIKSPQSTLLSESKSAAHLTPFIPPGITQFRPQTANRNQIGRISPPKTTKQFKLK